MANEFVARKGIVSPKLTTTLNASSKTITISGDTSYSSTNAQVAVTNGNLHIDPCTGSVLYLNYYTGTSIYFGNGGPANVSSTGVFTAPNFIGNWNGYTYASAATANTMVFRDVNGYIYSTYLNCSRGEENTTAASYVYDTGDGWLRKKSLVNTRTEIVGTITTNTIPKHNGTKLVDSRIADDGTWASISSAYVNIGQSPSYITIYPNLIYLISGGTFSVSGTLTCTGDIIAYYTSDEELKDNKTIISNAVDKIKQIGGYEFDWNDKQTTYQGHDIGVIAQEIEQVLPELVITRDNGYKAVKYEKIVALLIEGIKEQQIQIDELKKIYNIK